MLLLVHLEGTLFLSSLKMNAKRRDASEWFVDLDEALLHRFLPILRLGTDQNSSRDTQVAIEPRVPQTSAVALHAQLNAATGTALAPRLHLEVGTVDGIRYVAKGEKGEDSSPMRNCTEYLDQSANRISTPQNSPVGVTTDDLESISGLVLGTDPKGHQGGAVHRVEIRAAGLDLVGERLTLGQPGEARRLEPRDDVLDGMVGVGAAGEEGACLLGEGGVLRIVRHLWNGNKIGR